MKRWMVGVVVAVFAAQAMAQQGVSPLSDVELALKRVNLSVDRVRLDLADLNLLDRQGPRSALWEWSITSPLRLASMPGFMEDAYDVSDATDVAARALANLSRWQGRTVRRNLIGDPLARARTLAAGDAPVIGAVERVYKLSGQALPDDVRNTIRTNLTGAPLELQQKIAVLIHTMCDAQEWCQLAAEPISDADWRDLLDAARNTSPAAESPVIEHRRRALLARSVLAYDSSLAVAGAQDIAFAVGDLATLFVVSEEEPLFAPRPMAGAGTTSPGIGRGAAAPSSSAPRVTVTPPASTPPRGAQPAPRPAPSPPPNAGGATQPPPGPVNPAQPNKADNKRPNQPSGDREREDGMKNSSAPPPPPLYATESPKWSLDIPTPLGQISIGSEHKLTSGDMAAFLVIDWGGDDTYSGHVAANTAPRQRVSVLIDFGGNDKYVNTDERRGNFGAGEGGIGMLFDFAGNDKYKITQNGLGYSSYGVGVLFDHKGDDEYEGIERVQGCAATAGLALLADVSGKDAYRLYRNGQGYGGPGGAGALIDRGGDDMYIANDTDIRFPAAQTSEHNASLAQGCGMGIRGDYQQGLSLAGGVGVLLDGGGNDSYTAGVFAQGVGYWFGTGLLYDREGNDTYQAQWYAQGASAHMSVGALIDGAGNDTYNATMNVTQGAAHDVGAALLIDESGDDRYTAGNLAWGAGNISAVGLFIDRGGNDHYTLEGESRDNFGYVSPDSSASIRKTMVGMGLFLELGGTDVYPQNRGGNNRVWSERRDIPADVFPGSAHGIDLEVPRPSP